MSEGVIQSATQRISGRVGAKTGVVNTEDITGQRLGSWKEIASFLGRDESTVKRWEGRRGLPVRRVPGGAGAGVFAYAEELTAWLKSAAVSSPSAPASGDPVAAVAGPQPSRLAPARPMRPGGWLALALILSGLAVGAVAWRIGASARGQPGAAMERLPARPDLVALYLRARHDWSTRTPKGLALALDEYTQVAVGAPRYAPAYAGMADCYDLLPEFGLMTPEEAFPRAREAAERAIALDERMAGAHRALAFASFYGFWDFARADREFRRALALDPQSAETRHWFATMLWTAGQTGAAFEQISAAERLNPASDSIQADKALIEYWDGQGQQGVEELTRMEAITPGFISPHRYLAEIYFMRGDYPDSLREEEATARLLDDKEALGLVLAEKAGLRAGGPKAMRAVSIRMSEAAYSRSQQAIPLAAAYAAAGRWSDAEPLLRLAIARREPKAIELGVSPAFSAVYSNPEFRELLAQIRSHPSDRAPPA